MAPPKPSPSLGQAAAQQQEKWVRVTWMPHTTLAQTSHVCLSVRSAHATIDPLLFLEQERDEQEDEWRVRIGVYAIGGIPLLPLSCHTPGARLAPRREQQQQPECFRPSVSDSTHECFWDAFVQIPMRWRDLPRDSYVLFEVLRLRDEVVYEVALPFFSAYGRLETGLHKLELKKQSTVATDKNPGLHEAARLSTTEDEDEMWKASCILDLLARSEERSTIKGDPGNSFGQIPSVPWLDSLLKQRSKEILESGLKKNDLPLITENSNAFLIIELPCFELPVMHEETFYPTPTTGACGAVTPLDLAVHRKQRNKKASNYDLFDPLDLCLFLDYEDEHDNPVEDKYRTLAHDLLRGLVDPALKPDRVQRDRLAAIIDSTSHHLSREEKDILWRFRFSLVDNRRALTKFLMAVDWTVDSEVVQAAELLEQWRKRSPIEVTDALKLLGKHVAFQTNLVRSYAIDTLAAAPDSELRLYLLQLVQALKYENVENVAHSQSDQTQSPRISSLATFLIDRSSRNIELANYFYWYLKVELENQTHGARYREVFEALEAALSKTVFEATTDRQSTTEKSSKSFKSIVDSVSTKIGTSLLGSDSVKEKDRSHGSKKNHYKLTMWEVLVSQDNFISGLLTIQQQCRDSRGKKEQKEAMLQQLLSTGGYDRDPTSDPIPMPCAPEVLVNGIAPKTAKIFKSALYPALLDFHVEATLEGPVEDVSGDGTKSTTASKHEEHSSSFKVIVKTGDDLRQDQLIMMMIRLMDRLLKRAALDLCLTPYSIISTGLTSGLVEFVEGAAPISQVLSEHNGSILQYFQSKAGLKDAKYGIQPSVMATYIRSCAGYCVITYILGVGDRHLDNILLRASGNFFHIDFGFIFGRDPKPLPPAFRLTREMVEGMGGTESSEYRQFCSLACQAFNALRKSAGLILNLLYLMSDAGIEDLSNHPAADAEGVIAKVEERFRLDLTDEQSERYFVGLINDCLTALAPRVMDVFHSFAVARR